jgi:hypothetical protein
MMAGPIARTGGRRRCSIHADGHAICELIAEGTSATRLKRPVVLIGQCG